MQSILPTPPREFDSFRCFSFLVELCPVDYFPPLPLLNSLPRDIRLPVSHSSGTANRDFDEGLISGGSVSPYSCWGTFSSIANILWPLCPQVSFPNPTTSWFVQGDWEKGWIKFHPNSSLPLCSKLRSLVLLSEISRQVISTWTLTSYHGQFSRNNEFESTQDELKIPINQGKLESWPGIVIPHSSNDQYQKSTWRKSSTISWVRLYDETLFHSPRGTIDSRNFLNLLRLCSFSCQSVTMARLDSSK